MLITTITKTKHKTIPPVAYKLLISSPKAKSQDKCLMPFII